VAVPQDLRFCHRCATLLRMAEIGGHSRPRCPACGLIVYLDPKVVAAAIVPRGGHILLVQRNLEPGIGLWALPGGHVDRGEMVEHAVCREVREETGLEVQAEALVGIYSQEGQPVILAAYGAAIISGSLRADCVEVSDVRFFPPDGLPPLAFPRDRLVIRDWLSLGTRSNR